MNKFSLFFEKNKSLAPLFIRLMVGFNLAYGAFPVATSKQAMVGVTGFFSAANIPFPAFTACLVVWLELIGGCLYILGFLTRPAAFVLTIVFINAMAIAHMPDTYGNSFPAIAMLAGSLSLLFSGAGKVSVDALLDRKNS